MLKIDNKAISEEYEIAESPWKKALGLMFRKKVDKPLIFTFRKEKIISLHMWFVFTSIDVLFLNKNKKIVEMKQNFKPFKFYTPKKKARYIIELAAGTIKNNSIRIKQKALF
jgi:hypothetical protein